MKLLGSHPLDCCRLCPSCNQIRACRYDGSQIVPDETDVLVDGRLYTCSVCSQTFYADLAPMPGVVEADLMRVTDRREWARMRATVSILEVT